jgi:hypothetical protein
MNCDGSVDVGDVAPFIMALLVPAAYCAAFPCCNINRADVNMDGNEDGLDVNGFTQCVLEICP